MIEQTNVPDEFFDAYAKKIKEEEEARAAAAAKKKSKEKGENNFKFDEIQYVGAQRGRFLLLRFLGLPIGSEAMGYKRRPTDPKEIIQLELKDSKGKKFTVNLPVHAKEEKDEHILFRMYNKIIEKVKIDGVWVSKYKDKYPELYELATKGGFKKEEGNSYTYANGLQGTQVTIYNVIDRTDDWCEKNKHSKILCRDVNIDDQNRVWAKPGIKSYSLLPLGKLIAKYGLTEKYDVAFKRTGIQNNPYVILNASRLKDRDMMEDLTNDDDTEFDTSRIRLPGPLSEEETAYELYDLDKYYSPTKYTKIKERFPEIFTLCDMYLGTHFKEELDGYVEQEEKEAAARKAAREAAAESQENSAINAALDRIEAESNVETTSIIDDPLEKEIYGVDTNPTQEIEIEAPVRTRSAAKTETPNKIDSSLLKGYDNTPEEIRNRIVDVVKDGDKVNIVWDRKDDLLRCDTCGALSPESATHCPVCGVKF